MPNSERWIAGGASPSIRFLSTNEENASLGEELRTEVARCLTQNDPLNGDDVSRFERAIEEIAGRDHAIAVGSCTDALFFAFIAAGIGPGDEILVSAFSFIASASAILRTGAKPVFVDIIAPEARSGAPFTIDLDQARSAITSSTKALLWIGLFGGLANPDEISRFCEETGLLLFEDAAQSFGARFDGRHAGGLGVASCFSFDRHKVLGAPGTGGAVVTDDDAIAAQVRNLRWHGGIASERLGYNSQLSNIFAAVLNLKLRQHPQWIERRRELAEIYDEGLERLGISVPRWPVEVEHARHKYVILSEKREAIQSNLNARGVPTRRHYDCPLPAKPLFAMQEDMRRFPVSFRVAREAISLPIHPFLSVDDVLFVIEAIEEALD